MATVQVLVPCFNYGHYLEQCVQSALCQGEVVVDILIIDDCSSDNTPAVCHRLSEQDPRIRIIRHHTNMGHIATYNEGISQIRGDYFVLLSADDMLTPGALSRATTLMEDNPDIGLVYGHPVSFGNDNLPAPRTSSTGTSVWSGRRWMRHVCRSGKNFIVCPEAVVRAGVQRKIGGYNPDLPHSADMEMWLRIACVSDIGCVHGADQAYYRVHALSMQRTMHAGLFIDLVGRREAFRSLFEKEGASLPERDELHDLAKRALAFTAINHAQKLCHFPYDDALPASKYHDFAVSLYPEIVNSRRYRAFQVAACRAKDESGSTAAYWGARSRKWLETEILNRVEYHVARQTGLYLPRWML
jgi:glycosyltransferase involved in cell wall biosynthesis